MGTYKCCLIFKRRFRWTDAPPPDDVRALFAVHSGGAATMGADGLRRYLESSDPDAADDAEGRALRRMPPARGKKTLRHRLRRAAFGRRCERRRQGEGGRGARWQ